MAIYYRANLKDKQGNIIYPRIDPNITFVGNYKKL